MKKSTTTGKQIVELALEELASVTGGHKAQAGRRSSRARRHRGGGQSN